VWGSSSYFLLFKTTFSMRGYSGLIIQTRLAGGSGTGGQITTSSSSSSSSSSSQLELLFYKEEKQETRKCVWVTRVSFASLFISCGPVKNQMAQGVDSRNNAIAWL
jgi:hypothetical protein